jgi:hypothetical protein
VQPGAWDEEMTALALILMQHLCHGTCREEAVLRDLHPAILAGLKKLYDEALVLSTMVKRDVLSCKMTVALSPPEQRIDLSRVEIQWPMNEGPPAKRVLGTYSFGLFKHDESGSITVLLRPKVVTDQILGTRPQPSSQSRGPSTRLHGTKACGVVQKMS